MFNRSWLAALLALAPSCSGPAGPAAGPARMRSAAAPACPAAEQPLEPRHSPATAQLRPAPRHRQGWRCQRMRLPPRCNPPPPPTPAPTLPPCAACHWAARTGPWAPGTARKVHLSHPALHTPVAPQGGGQMQVDRPAAAGGNGPTTSRPARRLLAVCLPARAKLPWRHALAAQVRRMTSMAARGLSGRGNARPKRYISRLRKKCILGATIDCACEESPLPAAGKPMLEPPH
jgi:hypothetical protein